MISADPNGIEVQFGNAPISWGISEFGFEHEATAERMLDELKLSGYTGTELGDHGFFPKDPQDLRKFVKDDRGLEMIGAFCCYDLWDTKSHEKGREYARKVAQQLAAFADQKFPPHLVLSDAVSDKTRIANTGKITKKESLNDEKWGVLVKEIKYLKNMIEKEYGIKVCYHPHCGSFIETPWEIEALIRDVPDLKLIFDTAHITMGAHSHPMYLVDFLERFPERVASFHFKDYDPTVNGKDYFELVSNGCFPELGRGICDFDGIKAWQEKRGYRGWVLVEQDILQNQKSANPLQAAMRNMAYLRELYNLDKPAAKL